MKLPTWRPDRRELTWLLVLLGLATLLFIFVKLAGEVMEGDTQAFDTHVLRALRETNDPATPIGPRWLSGVAMDLTALGGPTVMAVARLRSSGTACRASSAWTVPAACVALNMVPSARTTIRLSPRRSSLSSWLSWYATRSSPRPCTSRSAPC